ncbi:hypothetical protein GM661_18530 [Iocasia frigidifontis]|uniref:Uncharacterized protein n=1 Tax=Iocasia fonsfrigidae TaxID=2682810 RepID=A0A8A7KDE5_9FIRM|nr:hypothetical protein [Iocasia fonsfrigidae]QTL99806.1 hypothetical protein GM661_18530 [Iocasia fonsfrigidae]
MYDENIESQLDFDLKAVLAFANRYEKLHEKGIISAEQLEQIITLIEDYQKYSFEEFKEKLRSIMN